MGKSLIDSKEKRERLAFLGGGLVVIIGGLWAAFVYFYPPKSDGVSSGTNVSATSGGVAVGGNVTNSTVTAGTPAGGDPAQKRK
jgi:hypothetical protein